METETSTTSAVPDEKRQAKTKGIVELIKAGKTPSEIARLLHSKRQIRENAAASPKTGPSLNSIINQANKIFGDTNEAVRWLETPIVPHFQATPMSLLGTRHGAACVDEILNQIERGTWTEDLDPRSLWAR